MWEVELQPLKEQFTQIYIIHKIRIDVLFFTDKNRTLIIITEFRSEEKFITNYFDHQ